MELLGKRTKALGQQLEGLDSHRQLPALRAHHSARDADPVAHIEVLELGECVFAERIDAAEQLDIARRVAQFEESDLTLVSLRHDATGNLHLVFG